MLQYNTSQNRLHAFSKIRNGNINVAGTGADKDYIKFGDCPNLKIDYIQ